MVVYRKVSSWPPLLALFLLPRSHRLPPVYERFRFQSSSSVLDSRPICPAAHEMPLLSVPPGRTQHVQTRTRSLSPDLLLVLYSQLRLLAQPPTKMSKPELCKSHGVFDTFTSHFQVITQSSGVCLLESFVRPFSRLSELGS